MRRAIEYTITNTNLDIIDESIENIRNVNRNNYWDARAQYVTLDIEFPETAIGQIDIGAMSSMRIKISASHSSNRTPIIFFEKNITRKDYLNAVVYMSGRDFPNAKNKMFTSMHISIENKEKKQNIRLCYITLKSEPSIRGLTDSKENDLILPSYISSTRQHFPVPTPPKKLNLINIFPTKTEEKPKINTETPKINIEKPKINIENNYKPDAMEVEIENLSTHNGINKENYDFTQSQEMSSQFMNIEEISPLEKPKIPTNSYNGLLIGCIITCCVENNQQKLMYRELIEVMGGIYIEENQDVVQFIITDGSDYTSLLQAANNGVKIVSPQWLNDCISFRKKLDTATYQLFN